MLKLPEIEQKPKVVEKARSYRLSVKLSPAQIANVEEIITKIECGAALPAWAYRANHLSSPDVLLARMGIMHLHIGSKSSRELLYLIQFVGRVVLLEISDQGRAARDDPFSNASKHSSRY